MLGIWGCWIAEKPKQLHLKECSVLSWIVGSHWALLGAGQRVSFHQARLLKFGSVFIPIPLALPHHFLHLIICLLFNSDLLRADERGACSHGTCQTAPFKLQTSSAALSPVMLLSPPGRGAEESLEILGCSTVTWHAEEPGWGFKILQWITVLIFCSGTWTVQRFHLYVCKNHGEFPGEYPGCIRG